MSERLEGTAVGAANELKEASRPFIGQKKWQEEIQVLTAPIQFLTTAMTIVRRERIVSTLSALYVERARSHQMSGDSLSALRRAVADFDEALKLAPNDDAVKQTAAGSYNALGCKDSGQSAIQAFTRAIELNPHAARFIANRGIEYANQNNHDAGIQDLTNACRMDGDPGYRKSLASAYNGKGCKILNDNSFFLMQFQIDEAREALSIATQLDPSATNYRNNYNTALRARPGRRV